MNLLSAVLYNSDTDEGAFLKVLVFVSDGMRSYLIKRGYSS